MPPSAKKRLAWHKTARLEFIEAIAYYADLNPTAAQRMRNEIHKAALSLIDTIPTPGRPGRKAGTFERILSRRTPFILVYRETKGVVHILRVIHHARKYP
ncbi:MAG: type II toxin-antitoxin system RelE/ParE family toxin [Thiobacillus sp.]|nr:type II toxin-antitoxin system RelE/ParE family toxin [Thiobacillus sp.]MDP2980048.1 type II toxin-antitoxin system RelE/ParE family toxin [Thiobacillus sp.]